MLETTTENQQALIMGLEQLIAISYVDDVEVFKTCLDYWNLFVSDIFTSVASAGLPGADGPAPQFSFTPPAPMNHVRKTLYAATLSKLRLLMINRMAKPEV